MQRIQKINKNGSFLKGQNTGFPRQGCPKVNLVQIASNQKRPSHKTGQKPYDGDEKSYILYIHKIYIYVWMYMYENYKGIYI